jgi:hypothetical protein
MDVSCSKAAEIDITAFLADAKAPEWEAFRAHFPSCPDCAREVARWTRIETALAEAAGAGDGHPAEEALLLYEDAPARLGSEARAAIELHLRSCAECADSLTALRSFGIELAGALAPSPAPAERVAPAGPGALWEWLALPMRKPALAFAALVLLALPAALYLWGVPEILRAPAGSRDATDIVREEIDAPIAPGPLPEERRPATLVAKVPPPEVPARALVEEEFAPEIEPAPQEELLAEEVAPERSIDTEVIPDASLPEAQPIVVAALDPALLPTAFPAYVSPWGARAGPLGRTSAAVRSAQAGALAPSPLAPERVGLTGDPQPTLYYFVPATTRDPIEIALVAEDVFDPLLELRRAPPVEAGIHPVSLHDHGVTLPLDTQLKWSVSIVADEGRREDDVVSSAILRHVEPSQELRAALAAVPREHAANLYAAHGLWYDAIASLSAFIEAYPALIAPRERRAALLEEQGLTAAADFDRRRD